MRQYNSRSCENPVYIVTSSSNRSDDENKAFFSEGLAKLRAGFMEESTGKLIRDLMEIQPDKALVSFAKTWLKAFPGNENAPRLVGNWLAKYKANDAAYLAINYVKTYPDVKALGPIVFAVGDLSSRPHRLFEAIEKRMETEPKSYVWGFLQSHQRPSDEVTDNFLLRWIDANYTNEDIVGSLSGVVNFSQSKEVLKAAMRWIDRHQSKYTWMVVSGMLNGKSESHKELATEIRQQTRSWLQKNSDDDFCGTIHKDLMFETRSLDDVRNAKTWYFDHPDSRSAWNALLGILEVMQSIGEAPDKEIVEQAKRTLSIQTPEDRIPALTGSLLRACPDDDSIKLAREALVDRGSEWLLAELLPVASDAELISKANEILAAKTKGSPELIVEMLKIDSSNDVARQAAKRWMRKYPDHEQVKTVKALLAN